MLEKIDLTKTIKKEDFKKRADSLRNKLGMLQRTAKDMEIPVMILFEGWDASGKGTLMNELILPLDPRGFQVFNIGEPTKESLLWPHLFAFWGMTPPKGRMSIFNRSWYRRMLEPIKGDEGILEDILSFERQLTDSGTIIIKFFLHISKKEQKKRLKRMNENHASTWRVNKRELENNENYDQIAKTIEETILRTDKEHAPWTIIEAEHRDYATIKILSTVALALEKQIQRVEENRKIATMKMETIQNNVAEENTIDCVVTDPSILKNLDLNRTVSDTKYRKDLKEKQQQFRELQYKLYTVRRPMVIVFEGQDASGKGGAIKRITQKLDPRGYEVNPTAAPNDWERAHHYLYRFWSQFPKAGHVGVFDRSWYGRVLVERVEGFCSEREWRKAYEEINEMEDQWARYGTIILKFWMQVDAEEQFRRLKSREENPEKNWKITAEDWRNREKSGLYEKAAEEMMLRTSTANAPWIIVEANDKKFARLKVLTNIVDALTTALHP